MVSSQLGPENIRSGERIAIIPNIFVPYVVFAEIGCAERNAVKWDRINKYSLSVRYAGSKQNGVVSSLRRECQRSIANIPPQLA